MRVANDDGSLLLEMLVLGFLVVVMLSQAMVAAGRLQAAGEEATEVAQRAALEAARWGDAESALRTAQALLPGAVVEARQANDRITVEVRIEVPLVGPSGAVNRTVVGRATARLSPYRSFAEAP